MLYVYTYIYIYIYAPLDGRPSGARTCCWKAVALRPVHLCMYVCVYVCMCIYIYIYMFS